MEVECKCQCFHSIVNSFIWPLDGVKSSVLLWKSSMINLLVFFVKLYKHTLFMHFLRSGAVTGNKVDWNMLNINTYLAGCLYIAHVFRSGLTYGAKNQSRVNQGNAYLSKITQNCETIFNLIAALHSNSDSDKTSQLCPWNTPSDTSHNNLQTNNLQNT